MARVAVLTFVASLLFPMTSQAESSSPGSRSSMLWDQAMTAIDEGNLEAARQLLLRSYEIRPDGQVACQLGLVSRRSSPGVEAVEWFDRCAQDASLSPEQRQRAARESSRLRGLLGQVEIVTPPEESEISIDGRPQALTAPGPHLVVLTPGTHRLTRGPASAGGGEGLSFEVLAGRQSQLDLREGLLEPVQPSGSARSRVAPAWALWTTLSVSLASLAGAGVLFGLDLSLAQETGRDDSFHQWSAVLSGFAGATLAVALVLIPYVLVQRRRATRAPVVAARPRPSRG